MAIDQIDRRILRELQANGALSAADVAGKVGLSTTTCWRRIQQLEQSGVIRSGWRCWTARRSGSA